MSYAAILLGALRVNFPYKIEHSNGKITKKVDIKEQNKNYIFHFYFKIFGGINE